MLITEAINDNVPVPWLCLTPLHCFPLHCISTKFSYFLVFKLFLQLVLHSVCVCVCSICHVQFSPNVHGEVTNTLMWRCGKGIGGIPAKCWDLEMLPMSPTLQISHSPPSSLPRLRVNIARGKTSAASLQAGPSAWAVLGRCEDRQNLKNCRFVFFAQRDSIFNGYFHQKAQE